MRGGRSPPMRKAGPTPPERRAEAAPQRIASRAQAAAGERAQRERSEMGGTRAAGGRSPFYLIFGHYSITPCVV